LQEQTATAGIEAIFQVKVGHPAEQIVYVAKEDKADAIVMGHRGETLLQRWLLGSVAKRVLSYAHCTVIIVR
jgi:nucleotide-binding universal stress UspA family protein